MGKQRTSRLLSLLNVVLVGSGLSLAPGIGAQASEPDPGDVGTKECRDVQIAAQAAIPSEPRNHGEVVRSAARVVGPFVEEGAISEACSSCIVNQIARRVPIEEQEPCGPDRICGDEEMDPGEECDDGNNADGDGCSADCRLEVCGGIAGFPCADREFCEFPAGSCDVADQFGMCVELPDLCICPQVFDPVCGCDGVTYTNDCVRRCAATSLDHPGECGAEQCGPTQCPSGTVCCNALLGICTRPGEACVQ